MFVWLLFGKTCRKNIPLATIKACRFGDEIIVVDSQVIGGISKKSEKS